MRAPGLRGRALFSYAGGTGNSKLFQIIVKLTLVFWGDCYYNRKQVFPKGGEDMALEGIQAVTQAEAKAKADRDAAAAQARQQLADAQRQARQLVDQARQQAQARARQMMAEAEEKAAAQTGQVLERAKKDCEAMKQAAKGRLEQAAQVIVEGVVKR